MKTTKQVSMKDLFGVQTQMVMDIPVQPPKFQAKKIPGYVFRAGPLSEFLVFWRLGRRACMFAGHKGCGKTSLPEQFHLVTNHDLLTMTGCEKTTLEALFGQYLPTESGNLVWQDGPVTRAARNGWSVLINEFNAMPPGIQIALNDIAHEGSAFSIPDTGEQFMPADGFRIIATQNPEGGNSHLYKGRKPMDAALKERWFWIAMDYGSEEEESAILSQVWQEQNGLPPQESAPYIKQMIAVARQVRISSRATNASAIPEIISTRVLVNWATYWGAFKNKSGAIHKGLQHALTNGCDPVVAAAIHQIVEVNSGVPSPYGLLQKVA